MKNYNIILLLQIICYQIIIIQNLQIQVKVYYKMEKDIILY